ncbi:MAG: ECF transporter S component [Patescibacteria group bacterium]
MRISIPSGALKFIIGWTAVFLFRLIPFRPPNFEPMLATVMPFSKRYGLAGSFLFGFLGIVLFDAVTSGWGIWTAVTAVCYGLLGVGAHLFFKNREASVKNFLMFGVPGTILYDAVTMLIGPVFTHQSFSVALMGQIPFTLMHVLGTVVFSVLLAPSLYRWVIQNEQLELAFPLFARSPKSPFNG